MPTVTIYTTKDASAYKGNDGWSGWDDHHPVGMGSDKYRSFIYFPISFTGWTAVNSASLFLRGHRAGSGNHVFGDTSTSRNLHVERMISDWGEGTNRGETLWSSAEPWGWTNRATASTTVGGIGLRTFTTYSEGTWYEIDITGIVQQWFAGQPNYGVVLWNHREDITAGGLEFYARDKGTGYKPYLVIDYSTNTAPNAPTSLAPTADALVNTLTPTFTGTRSDPDSGDYITAYQIQLYADNGTTLIWDSGTITTSGTPATFSKVYAGTSLSGGTFYKWKGRTRDRGATWGPYSALQRFKVNSPPNPPTLSIVESPITALNTLTPTLVVTHSDNDPADTQMYGYRILIETSGGASVWDSGDVDTSGSPVTSHSETYSGPSLTWGTGYRWTARTKDQNGTWGSDAAYQSFATRGTQAPINLSPSNHEAISGLVPTFHGERASSNDDIVSYRIVLKSGDGSTTIWDTGDITTGIAGGVTFDKVYDGTALSYNTEYLWQARITGTIGGASVYSGNNYFSTPVDATVPTQNLPTPNNSPTNQNVTSLTPTFTGGRSTAFTHVQIELYPSTATSSNLTGLIWDSGDITQSSGTTYSVGYSGPALSWATSYKWRVRVGAPGFGGWSGLQQFTMDSSGGAVLTSPADSAWLTTATPTLQGSTSAGENATNYRIRLYESNGVTLKWDSGDITQSAATTFSKVYNGPALTPGNDYLWQARYGIASGLTGPYSTFRSFRVNGAPTVPTSLEPVPGFANPDLTPTFKAFFNDPEKAAYGDLPTSWVIEIRNNLTDALIQTKTLTTGLSSGLNVYDWGTNTGGSDTGLAYDIDYKWRTKFVDSKSADGAWSSYQVFRNAQAGTVGIVTPSNGSNITTTRPIVSWTFVDAIQAKFRVKVIRDLNDTIVYDSGVRVSTADSFQIPTGFLLKNTEFYRIQVQITDTYNIDSNIDEVTVQLELAAPPAIEGLSATVLEDTSAILLDWDPSSLGAAFVTYVVYRRKAGDDDWGMIGVTSPQTNTSFIDYYAGQTVNYEYRVTVVKLIANEPDLESPDSDIVSATLQSDVWFVVGRDRSTEHIFELYVESESHTRPVQQEVFENIGTNRKTVTRGFVLGWEGSVNVKWLPEEKATAEAQLDYILFDAGPHILKNPFGDVYDVTFGTPDGAYQGAGVQDATLTWIEIGTKTHNPTLTPDQFLAQIGAA